MLSIVDWNIVVCFSFPVTLVVLFKKHLFIFIYITCSIERPADKKNQSHFFNKVTK